MCTEPYVEEKSFYKNGGLLASIYGLSYLKQEVTGNITAQCTKMSAATLHLAIVQGVVEVDEEHKR